MKAPVVLVGLLLGFVVVCKGYHYNEELAIKMPYFLVRDQNGSVSIENLTMAADKYFKPQERMVQFYFYSRSSSNLGARVTKNNLTKIKEFDPAKETIFIVHGWNTNYTGSMSQTVKDAYLKSMDVNIFVVNWGSIASKNYVTARASIAFVGNRIGEFMKSMVDNNKLDLKRTAIAGHSLGAHVSGIAGYNLKKSSGILDHIIGLDPAGPLFLITGDPNRLDKTDAKFVHVIHTCAGYLGFPLPLGTADYWPNGGRPIQPGCGKDVTGSCSHSRSFQYYSESLVHGNFTSYKCFGYGVYRLGLCKNNDVSLMGEDARDKNASGNYFLVTNSEYPYAKRP